MEYEVYRGNDSSDEDFIWISDFFKQVLREDKDLCTAAQKNLQGGIFRNGELHPQAEKVRGLTFQLILRKLIDIATGSIVFPTTLQGTRRIPS